VRAGDVFAECVAGERLGTFHEGGFVQRHERLQWRV
jgi:hypothetical protein